MNTLKTRISTTEVEAGDVVWCYNDKCQMERVEVEAVRRIKSLRYGEPDTIRVSTTNGLLRTWNAAGSVVLEQKVL